MHRTFTLSASLLFTVCASARTFYVNPVGGNDTNPGTASTSAWKSFAKLEETPLASGDKVLVAPGVHEKSLHPKARGTAKQPVVIEFLPGTHEFAPEQAIRRPLFVSNSCDAPTIPKPFGILIENCAHLRLLGRGDKGNKKPLLLMGGRMIEAANLTSENIAYQGLAFDLKRPTVSEFRVIDSAPGHSDIQIAEGSTVAMQNGKLSWTGDIGTGAVMAQQAVLAEGRCWRLGFNWNPFDFAASTDDLGGGKYRLNFKDNYRLQTGHQFQFRPTLRDSVGIHNARSKNIVFEDCDIYALTNMGIVSQFTENLAFRRVRAVSPADTLRTCPAWGDIFHFSNCRGQILVEDCATSGMQDDALNCHGTHLRITAKPAENQLTLRYMHPQTYGFAPYIAGDELAVFDHQILRELPNKPRRKVTACTQTDKDGKEWTVTLDGPAPAYQPNNVVDNVNWHPDLTVRNLRVDMDSCRGILVTTRGKVVVEGCTFHRCAMPGILIEDDANGWFESTCIRDMIIRNNSFTACGISINPEVKSGDLPVHENIRIIDNIIDEAGISAHHVKNLTITGNKTKTGIKVGAQVHASCSEVTTD